MTLNVYGRLAVTTSVLPVTVSGINDLARAPYPLQVASLSR